MRATSVDLIGGYYTDDSLPWACQDTVNWLPVMAEVAGTLTPKRLATPPGLRPYQAIGTGPIRGVHDCEGLRLVVSGSGLYRITNDGVGVLIGQIPGVGRVSMTHNQFKTGNQVLVENGQVGGGYVYNTVDQTFGRITDEGYPGSISSDYLDSFLLGVEPLGRYWFHSNLADATDYNTLDRYEAEASPDRIVGLATSRDEVVVFGQRTTEFFFNAGQATGTFQNRRTTMDRGCAGRHTIQKLDNTLFWLGDDGVVYRLNGYAPEPVSTRVLDRAISDYNWSEAFAFVWEDRGFKVYYLTFPDGMTFGYDVVTRVWHRRESFGLSRWRLTDTIRWGRKWYGGDFQTGRVWELDWDYYREGNQPIISERTSPVLSDSQSRIGLKKVELQIDTGQGDAAVAAVAGPRVSGSVPDGVVGQTLSARYIVSGGAAPYGPFEIVAGQLPQGLALAADGAVTGVPTLPGSYMWTVGIRDAAGELGMLRDASQVVEPQIEVWALLTGVDTIDHGQTLLVRADGTVDSRFEFLQGVTANYSMSNCSAELPNGNFAVVGVFVTDDWQTGLVIVDGVTGQYVAHAASINPLDAMSCVITDETGIYVTAGGRITKLTLAGDFVWWKPINYFTPYGSAMSFWQGAVAVIERDRVTLRSKATGEQTGWVSAVVASLNPQIPPYIQRIAAAGDRLVIGGMWDRVGGATVADVAVIDAGGSVVATINPTSAYPMNRGIWTTMSYADGFAYYPTVFGWNMEHGLVKFDIGSGAVDQSFVNNSFQGNPGNVYGMASVPGLTLASTDYLGIVARTPSGAPADGWSNTPHKALHITPLRRLKTGDAS